MTKAITARQRRALLGSWLGVAPGLAAAIGIIAAGRWNDHSPQPPSHAVPARITWLSIAGSKYQRPRGIRVVAMTTAGAAGSAVVEPDRVEHCRIGDVVEAEQTGIELVLKLRPCRSP